MPQERAWLFQRISSGRYTYFPPHTGSAPLQKTVHDNMLVLHVEETQKNTALLRTVSQENLDRDDARPKRLRKSHSTSELDRKGSLSSLLKQE